MKEASSHLSGQAPDTTVAEGRRMLAVACSAIIDEPIFAWDDVFIGVGMSVFHISIHTLFISLFPESCPSC